MSFEGSEKKAEVVMDRAGGAPPLLGLGRGFWEDVARAAGAAVLSETSDGRCRAFLLSESSLFVWDRSVLMITCGTSDLVGGVLRLLGEVGASRVASLIYQRKNEYHRHLQASTFHDDAARLGAVVEGRAVRFGHAGEHHNLVFHTVGPFRPEEDDVTTELLMHHIRGPRAGLFRAGGAGAPDLRGALGLGPFLDGFAIDDHAFAPRGYSLNAVRDGRYMTLHVTPEEDGSYASFETNLPPSARPGLLAALLGTFRPFSFDLIDFNAASPLDPGGGFVRAGRFRGRLGSGHLVDFRQFVSTDSGVEGPAPLDVGLAASRAAPRAPGRAPGLAAAAP